MYQRKIVKMDLDKMLRHVNNLNDYIAVTQEVAKQSFNSSKVQFNMSTVLLLKKVRSLEIEYFNKCEGNGAALVLFEKMVDQPPSKIWGLIGKELVMLLQYWLDAMRKHLIRHNHNWWTFLKLLLKFIISIRTKHQSLPDNLVEGITESLLDLATSSQPETLQRHEILCCLNLFCAESSREIRFAFRNKFESYFVKLASLVVSCGLLPTQYSALETLLRWLLPRQSASLRQAAARKWFPEGKCSAKAVELFLERNWLDFYQDARDFLNALNIGGDAITSVVCRKVTVGDVTVVKGVERRLTWLDVNASNKSVSVVLDVSLLDAVGITQVSSWETLVIPDEDVVSVEMLRESSEVFLVLRTSHPPRLRPGGTELAGCEVKAVLSTASDLQRVDRALRDAFGEKYQVLLDVDTVISLSPQEPSEMKKKIISSMEEDTRFSHPADVHRRKHSGFIVRPRIPVSFHSPSTASTSSLAQLHEKLESLPQYKFDKEAVHVCALPELSTVTEVSEADDRQSVLISQTLKINRPVGVCQKNFQKSERNSQSDSEVQKKSKTRYLSPVEQEHDASNCLLVATIGSADDSIINDTLERLTKNKDFRSDNIVNLLVQEALEKDLHDREFSDSGINTGDNTKKTQNVNEVNSEAIENTPLEKLIVEKVVKAKEREKTCTVISNTTTDESNDVVCETPKNFVTVRRRLARTKSVKDKENVHPEEDERQIFDVNTVEEFFSQHIAESKRGDILISPTLARKINETSSESEQFDDCLIMHEDNNLDVEQIELQDINIVECLNSMVDRVCSDFEKCTEFLNKDTKEMDEIEEANVAMENPPDIIPLTDVSNIQNVISEKETPKETVPKKSIRLKYTAKKTPKVSKSRVNAKKKNNKLELQPTANMSPIIEKGSDEGLNTAAALESPKHVVQSPKTDSPASKLTDQDTPLLRRKRKLYSPKYENIGSEKVDIVDDKQEFRSSKLQSPKYKSTCYKDIETERKKRIRQPRAKKSRGKSETPSPKTKKMNDLFDQLKEKVECPVNVISVNRKIEKDMAAYNFTSESEDEDFKKKKIELKKRISSTTIASGDSAMSTRKGRTVNRINYTENKSSDETIKKIAPRSKRTVRRKRTPRTRIPTPVNDLIDERMREAKIDELNTSIIVVEQPENIPKVPQLVLAVNPEIEPIPDEVVIVKDFNEKPKKINKKQKKIDALSLKKERNENVNALNVEQDTDDRTISPLPGLVIETIPLKDEDANESVYTNMLQKMKKIHEGGPEEFINETNTTQNLLSDVERINYSPTQINITDELNTFENIQSKIDDENTRSSSKSNARTKQTNVNSTQILHVKKEESEKNKRKAKKVAPVINLSDTKSEKSIATVGKSPITAHGDSDEAPPQSEQLTEYLKPRDLEIEHLDESMKDYFNKLRDEVDDMPTARRQSNDSVATKIIQSLEKENSIEKSPVVSIKRLSFDDISKWLPSPRHSDTDSSSEDFKKVTKPNKSNTNNRINKDSSNDKELNNITKEKPTFHCDDIDIKRSKKIKTKNLLKGNNRNPDKSVKSTDISRNNSSSSIWLRSHGEIDQENSFNKHIGDSTKNPVRKSAFTQNIDTIKNSKKSNKVDDKQANRKSMISPIKFFDEISPERPVSPILRSSTRAESTINKQSSFIRPESSIEKLEIVEKRQSSDEDNRAEETSKISSKKKLNKKAKKASREKAERSSSPDIEVRVQTRVSPRRKRKSDSPEMENPKRRKIEDVVTMHESGPSVSSVNEWFRRNLPVSRAESMNTSFKDNIQSVIEKLDTTLVEIHQNTSKQFIHLFVDAQSRLADMNRERRTMYKTVASEILAQVVSVIDEKFADLDRRSQQMHSEFTERLKSQASALIREDCKKKQLMVSLLREDLNATLEDINKKRGSS